MPGAQQDHDVDAFRELTLSGTPRERGRLHGAALATGIGKAIEYYGSIFNLSQDEIFRLVAHFRELIGAFRADYIEEMEGIAEGANADSRWIVALNARTEILSRGAAKNAGECSSLFFRNHRILGQNWDWAAPLEPLVAVVKIEFEDGFSLCTLTEPGILGKVGLNSEGLGVCLNILFNTRPLDGLPIHILLRGILESRSLDAARGIVENHAAGKASNVLVATADGDAFQAEFDTETARFLDTAGDYAMHTNHYLCEAVNSPEEPLFLSSYNRIETLQHLLHAGQDYDLDHMIGILSDRSNTTYPVLRDYVPDPDLGSVGTIFSLIMELHSRTMLVRRGNRPDNPFKHYRAD